MVRVLGASVHVNITSGERHGPCPYNAAGLTARMISRMCPRSSEHEYEHSSSKQERSSSRSSVMVPRYDRPSAA